MDQKGEWLKKKELWLIWFWDYKAKNVHFLSYSVL